MNWTPVNYGLAALLLALSVQAEETPELEFLLFLSEYTDENGNWSAPDMLPDNNPTDTDDPHREETQDE